MTKPDWWLRKHAETLRWLRQHGGLTQKIGRQSNQGEDPRIEIWAREERARQIRGKLDA